MADKDPWIGINWKVYATQGAGGAELKPPGKMGAFTLNAVASAAGGTIAYYTASFTGDDMPAGWESLKLYPRGNVVPPPPSPLLQPWTKDGDAPWLAAADAVRAGMNDSTARLEGVLNPETNPAALTLISVPKATTVGTPLLVMKVTSASKSGSAQPQEINGAGHGDN